LYVRTIKTFSDIYERRVFGRPSLRLERMVFQLHSPLASCSWLHLRDTQGAGLPGHTLEHVTGACGLCKAQPADRTAGTDSHTATFGIWIPTGTFM